MVIMLLLLIASLFFSSCESPWKGNFFNEVKEASYTGKVESRTRQMKAFHEVEISVPGRVQIIQGNEKAYQVKMTGKSDYLDDVKCRVEDGELKIGFNSKITFSSGNQHIEIVIYTPKLDGIDLSGAVRCEMENWNTQKAIVECSGASNLAVNKLEAGELSVDCSGASKLHLKGKIRRAIYDLSGASNVNAIDLVSEESSLDCSGASRISVNVQRAIWGDVSGASHVTYAGNPQKVSVDKSGASSMHAIK